MDILGGLVGHWHEFIFAVISCFIEHNRSNSFLSRCYAIEIMAKLISYGHSVVSYKICVVQTNSCEYKLETNAKQMPNKCLTNIFISFVTQLLLQSLSHQTCITSNVFYVSICDNGFITLEIPVINELKSIIQSIDHDHFRFIHFHI
jgi:hypothetical protein